MGIYRPLIDRFQGNGTQSTDELPPPSDKIVTPSTILSLSRIPLSLLGGEKLLRGKPGAALYLMAMGLTDIDGGLGRYIDKRWPNWGRGRTEFGGKADPAADSCAVTIVSGALLFARRVSPAAKVGTAILVGKEMSKMAWYRQSSNEYKQALIDGSQAVADLDLPVDNLGKEATFEELIGVACAAMTSEVTSRRSRAIWGGLALAHSVAAMYHGEQVRRGYDETLDRALPLISGGEAIDLKTFNR